MENSLGITETRPIEIFQLWSNALATPLPEYAESANVEIQNTDIADVQLDYTEFDDAEDAKFLQTFSPPEIPLTTVDISIGSESRDSVDSCVDFYCSTSPSVNDETFTFNGSDFDVACEFVRENESSSDTLVLSPFNADDDLNLPFLPKLGFETGDSYSKSAGSTGDLEDESENDSMDSDSEYHPPNRKGCKNVLLWKFLLKALAEVDGSNGALQWENKRRGIFKFNDTVRISKLWGNMKNKPDMNFEKLSRGIRHYYRSDRMKRISGRRLVYQFNWKKIPKSYRQNCSDK